MRSASRSSSSYLFTKKKKNQQSSYWTSERGKMYGIDPNRFSEKPLNSSNLASLYFVSSSASALAPLPPPPDFKIQTHKNQQKAKKVTSFNQRLSWKRRRFTRTSVARDTASAPGDIALKAKTIKSCISDDQEKSSTCGACPKETIFRRGWGASPRCAGSVALLAGPISERVVNACAL